MRPWPSVALERLRQDEALAVVTLLAVEGSAPREAGTRMLVWAAGQWGTIGGGNLEHQAAAQARRMLVADGAPAFAVQDYPLGPLLAQCCGGRVRLAIERLDGRDGAWLAEAEGLAKAGRDADLRVRLGDGAADRSLGPERCAAAGPQVNGESARARGVKPGPGDELAVRLAAPAPPLLLLGAGHVGQAIARAVAPLPFRLDWFDVRPDVAEATGATAASAADLARLAGAGAPFTLILTHDHALDYALTRAALSLSTAERTRPAGSPSTPSGSPSPSRGGEMRLSPPSGGSTAEGREGGDGYLGLIGSKTKRARFVRRLRDDGVAEAALARLVCPIGLPGLTGKAPEIIAASVAADLLIRLQALAVASL